MDDLKRETPEAGQASGGAFDKVQGDYNTVVQNLCSGYGSYHSPNAEKNPRPLIACTLADVETMLADPPSLAKDAAQWVIPSTLLSRTHAEQHKDGKFWALWADIDEPDGVNFDELAQTAEQILPGDFMAYTSRSATEERQKARLIVPLSCAVSGGEWKALQKILNDKLQAAGITPDRVTERTGQLCYLPNRGEFYNYHHEPLLGPMTPESWADELAEEAQRQATEEAARKAKQKPERSHTYTADIPPGGVIPSEYIRSNNNVRELLVSRGAVFVSEKRFYPADRTDDGFPGGVYDPDKNRFYTHHHNDPFNDGYWHGAIDLLCSYHRIDWNADGALVELCRVYEVAGGVTIELHNQRAHMAAKDAPQADMNALFSEPEEDAPERPSPAGVDLLNPPGLTGEICRYMKLTARRPCPELYPFAALHLMALIGRKRKSVYTKKLNLITLAIAPTAAGKEKAQDAVKRLAHNHNSSKLIHGNAGSFKELIVNLLEGQGSSIYVVDEIHSLLGSMKDKNAATYETKMEAEILTMFGTELYTFRGMEKRSLMEVYLKELGRIESKLEAAEGEDADKLTRVLEKVKARIDWLENGLPNPFFSLMGHSVPERLDSFIKTENIASGFLGRALIVRGRDTRAKLRRTPVDEHALALCEFNITNGLTDVGRGGGTIAANDEAADYLDECIDWYEEDDQLNDPIGGGIYARAPEHLYRVATILALETGTITLEHAQYANALVKQSIDDVKYILLKAYSESDGAKEKPVMAHAKETIHRNCKGAGLPLSRLKDLVTRPKGWKEMQKKDVKRDRLAELLALMVADGELEKVMQGRKERYLSRAVV
jgi:hypothetical protein